MILTIIEDLKDIPKIGDIVTTGMREEYEWTVYGIDSCCHIIKRNNILYKSKSIKAKRKGNKKTFHYVTYNNNDIVYRDIR